MRMLFRTGLVVSAMALAAPVGARAQSTVFDGSYVGVSGAIGQGGTVNCPPVTAPAPLTIANGNVTSSMADSFHGTVGPDGHVVLHSKGDIRYEGKIDGRVLKVGGGTPRCTFYFTWQKR